ncbi:accessory Sec system S-layer assembly protein [Psychrobacillus sp. NPDC096426]|uniref:accessory Sec system S-layer assembly protein n=1 Tax=Psychrobacillus sp. NPDC096426 TaxID=3364491 RepID=UPI00381CCAD3
MAFFKKKKNEETEEKIETATAEEAVATNADGVYTKLLFHPSQNYSTAQTYVLKFHHEQLPSLKPNQISISGIRLIQLKEKSVIEAFIRNTLDQPVQFPNLDLIVLDEAGQALAKKSFDMSIMEAIPALSSMPWKFPFEKENILVDQIPEDGWKIAFELKQQPKEHTLDLAPSWEEQLTPEQREHLEKVVSSLPKLGETEVNFMGLEAKFKEDNSLAASVLIRNGNMKSINIEQLPLVVEDAKGDHVCQGSFALEDFSVKANSTKPWTFIFPEALVQKKDPDFSRWKVYIPDNN